MINTKKVAELLKVSETYIRRICNEGRIRCKKIGRDWVILERESDIHKFGKEIISKKKKGKK